MDIELSFDAGRIDVVFSGDGMYASHTISLEQAIDLSDDLSDMVNTHRGERSPRVYDAENEHLERITNATNMLNSVIGRCEQMRHRIDQWMHSRDSFSRRV